MINISDKQYALIRFWTKVKVDKWQNCWLWQGYRLKQGYGHARHEGKLILSHRLVFILFDIEIPIGLDVLHSCDNPPCVNPAHLFFGTHADNMRDKSIKNRNPGCRKLTPNQVKIIKNTPNARGKIRHFVKLYGVSRRTISDILKGKYWKHIN